MGAFEELMGTLDHPLFIVTTAHQGQRSGCLVGFATQTSIHPPRFLVALSDKNRTLGLARGAEHLAVHLVPDDATALAELFGGRTGDELDKFAHCAWHEGPHGLPILDDCESWFAGRVLERRELGDHIGFLLAPEEAEHRGGGRQLHFDRARSIEPGHAP